MRRVVASPEPQSVLEIDTIRNLVHYTRVLICAGGGGVPVMRGAGGLLQGVEAVIDKDRASALLARQLHADALLMLTDVDGVYANWGKPGQRRLTHIGMDELNPNDFESGSMGPKIAAAMGFLERGGKFAGIGQLGQASAIMDGHAGTIMSRVPQT